MSETSFIIVVVTLFTSPLIAVVSSPAQDKAVNVPFWKYENNGISSLDDLVLKFSEVEEIGLKQPWLPAPEPGFNPTCVKVTWKSEGLYIFARLHDNDIVSRSTHLNQRLWELGDVFETFIRFKEADAYYEFHVCPNNHVVQLRFDVNLTPEQRRLQLSDLFITEQVVKSEVWLEVAKNQWYVLLEIPASLLKPSDFLAAGDTFEFSFSRYDYSHASEEPVLSSSSGHKEPDFHCRDDWGILHLEDREN